MAGASAPGRGDSVQWLIVHDYARLRLPNALCSNEAFTRLADKWLKGGSVWRCPAGLYDRPECLIAPVTKCGVPAEETDAG